MTKDSISNYRTKVKGYQNASSPVNRVCGRIPRIPPESATEWKYSMTQLRSVTCHMGSHIVTCYPTQCLSSGTTSRL